MSALQDMIETLAKDGYAVHIRKHVTAFMVTVTDKKLVVSSGESELLDEALADAFDMTPAREPPASA